MTRTVFSNGQTREESIDNGSLLVFDQSSFHGLNKRINFDPESNRWHKVFRPDYGGLLRWAKATFGQNITAKYFATVKSNDEDYNAMIPVLGWLENNGWEVFRSTFYRTEDEETTMENIENASFFNSANMIMNITDYVASGGRNLIILTSNSDFAHTLRFLKDRYPDLHVTIIGSRINQDMIEERKEQGKIAPLTYTSSPAKLRPVTDQFIELLDIEPFRYVERSAA